MPSAPRLSFIKPDGTLKTAEEVQREANELVSDAQARAERVRTEIGDNIVEATSKNQAATVIVTAAGALRTVRFNDRIKQMTPAQVAAAVMEAYQQATREAAARTIEITERELGDGRITAMMRDLLPDEPDPEA